uniref:Uncharacterized protein n=1 Tax=Amphimedon queenslandica TaxID=400682 RepID=A0A1X7SRG0_AMPQE
MAEVCFLFYCHFHDLISFLFISHSTYVCINGSRNNFNQNS